MTASLRALVPVFVIVLLAACQPISPEPADTPPAQDDDDDATDPPGDELRSDLPRDTNPQVSGGDIALLVDGNADFALELYAGLAEETKQRFRDLLSRGAPGRSFVSRIIGRRLENE